MDKQTQDLAWACLPKEMREEVRKEYYTSKVSAQAYTTPSWQTLEWLYGYHNLTSEAVPEEMLYQKRAFIMAHYSRAYQLKCDKDEKWAFAGQEIEEVLYNLFGDKCLPDPPNTPNSGELKPQLVEGEPKFHEGEIVVCLEDGRVGCVAVVQISDNGYVYELVDDKARLIGVFNATELEYYTEPETKDMEEKELGKEDNFPTKELNLCELLKDCIGEEFYSLIDGEVKLKQLTDDVICQYHKYHRCGYLSGCSLDGACLLYPSRSLYEKYPLDAKAAWEAWASESKPKRWRAKCYERYWRLNSMGVPQNNQDVYSNNGVDQLRYDFGNYFRTEEEAQQAAEAVRECLEKFHQKGGKP